MTETQLEFSDVLDRCIEDIKAGRLTVDACLDRYPEFASELKDPLMAAVTLQGLPIVKPSDIFRQQARTRLMVQLSPMPDGRVSIFEALRKKWTHFFIIPQTRRYSMGWMLALLLVASVLVGGGTAYASDTAVPGQPLYGLDRSLEEIQSDLTNDPEAYVALQLAFAEERLSEAQELATDTESEGFQEALDGYGESIGAVVQKFASAEEIDLDALEPLLDQALADHDVKLAALASSNEEDDEDDCDVNEEEDCEENDDLDDGDLDGDLDDGDLDGDLDDSDKSENSYCTTGDHHPVALKLAGQYGEEGNVILVDEIMDWFCGVDGQPGVGFGQIMHALQTQKLLGNKLLEAGEEPLTADDILDMKVVDGMGWGQIWRTLGLKGKSVVDDTDDTELSGDNLRPEPPGQAKKSDQQEPPGQAKKADQQVPPGQAKKTDRQEPPGQAKKSEQQEPSDEAGDSERPEPPGQSKKSDNQEPQGQANNSDQQEPPGQAKKSDQQQPPGQAKKSDQQPGNKNKNK